MSQSVVIIGATGRTGSVITSALLEKPGQFAVHIAVRPESASKPIVKEFESKGAKVHLVDIEKATAQELAKIFTGIDTVISCLLTFPFTNQNVIVDACKLAHVKRFVPSEWATAKKRDSIGTISEQKAEVKDYILETGVPYTCIDVGWWMQILLPVLDPAKTSGISATFKPFLEIQIGNGDVKSATIDLSDVGPFVARIIADERTLNRYVFIYAEHVTQKEVFALAERVSGRLVHVTHKSAEEFIKETREMPEDADHYVKIARAYLESIYINGDNTVERAKEDAYGNALDARELYPDIKPKSLGSFAREYYSDLK